MLLGFVVFLAFESYDTSRSGAEAEAQIVTEQFETAQFFPAAARAPLSGELVCYARTVIHKEWPQMQAGTLGDTVNPWGVATFRTLKTVDPRTASEQAAFAKWLDERSDREDARAARDHGAEAVIPAPLWIVLLLSATMIFVFMLFFADSAERAVVQATMMGGVAVVISSTLLLLGSSTTPITTASAASNPSQWSARSASSTKNEPWSERRSQSRATRKGPRAAVDTPVSLTAVDPRVIATSIAKDARARHYARVNSGDGEYGRCG